MKGKSTRSFSLSCLMCLALLFVSGIPSLSVVQALRHSFTTENDERHVIGPVGVPFGFASKGHYELTVFDFELTLGETSSGSKSFFSRNSNKKKDKAEEEELWKRVMPGFYLHRFSSEAAYAKFLNRLQNGDSVINNTSSASSSSSPSPLCSFQYYLDPDGEGDDSKNNANADPLVLNADDDIAFAEVGEIPSAEHGILLMMTPPSKKWKPNQPTIDYTFKEDEAGLYFLTYQICFQNQHDAETADIRSRFELDFHFLNMVGGHASYLTVGELQLPHIFFFFSLSYLVCCICWIMNIRNINQGGSGLFSEPTNNDNQNNNKQSSSAGRPVVYPIHKLMGVLLTFKFLSVFFESIRYHAIRITGHAEVWTVFYYAITFVKGIFLFTVILLIGTGWSFVKPFLNVNEKRIVFSILVLQVLNNLAIVVLSRETAGEKDFDRWSAILHLVDIICCCTVLLPIVWQVSALEKSLPESMTQDDDDDANDGGRLDEHDVPDDEEELDQILLGGNKDDNNIAEDSEQDLAEKGQILSKLKLFRSFYLLVVAYIYLTRIIVYLFSTALDYQHIWIRYAVVEIITLTFYVVVGILFRPMSENPYLAVPSKPNQSTSSSLQWTTSNKNNTNSKDDSNTGIALPVRKKEGSLND